MERSADACSFGAARATIALFVSVQQDVHQLIRLRALPGAFTLSDEGRPDHDTSSGTSATWPISSTGDLVALAARPDAADALRADRCRVRGARREHHRVSRAELDVAASGVEHDPAARASARSRQG